MKPFREKILAAKGNREKLKKILVELSEFRVLDPACGSGNFLYVAFRELRNLEFEIMELLRTETRNVGQRHSIAQVVPSNFYGIDTNGFGVEIAKIALSIGRKLSADEHNTREMVLPFEDLEENFLVADALYVEWPPADAIVGNPPFIGGKYIREKLGDERAERLYERFPEVKGQVDYCVHWFRLAHDHPAKRVGLVGTNSISQNTSRTASLEYIVNNGGRITNAISTQIWPGDAVVHVSIVNWIKDITDKTQCVLDGLPVPTINSSLKSEISLTSAKKLKQNLKLSFESCQLAGKGFSIPAKLAEEWIKSNSKNREVLKPMLDGSRLVNPNAPLDWVIDFNDLPIEKAALYKEPFEHCQRFVRPERLKNKEPARRNRWWQFGRPRPQMRKALGGKKMYFCLSKVAKYTNFRSISCDILPCEANMVIASDDFFILGVLNSRLHLEWTRAQMSTMKSDPRYTNTTCFETFPFVWDAPARAKEHIIETMKNIEDVRIKLSKEHKVSLTDIYNKFYNEPASELYKLHEQLDKQVFKFYGFQYGSKENFNLELLQLNHEIAAREANKKAKKMS